MAEEKQKEKAKEAPKAAAKPAPKAKPAEALFDKMEHLMLARAMHGAPKHVVAAAIALIEQKHGKVVEAIAKSEVASAIKALATAKVKKGE